jgi:hypothetical protein
VNKYEDLTTDKRKYIDWSLVQPTGLFWLSSYVASHCLAVVLQSSAKQYFYFNVYYIILNSNCEAQRAFKELCEIELEAKSNV